MLKPGPAKKITIYVGEDVHRHGEPIYLAVLNHLFSHGVAGTTVTKGVAGFGAHHHLHTARILEISENLPVKIEFIETAESVEALLPDLLRIVGDGLVESQDTQVLQAPSPDAPGRRSRP